MINTKKLKSTFLNKHFYRFIIVGTINSIIDITLFTTFHSYFSLNIITANIISTSLAISVSFILNKHFVFEKKNTTHKHLFLFVFWTLINVWLVQSIVIIIANSIFKTYIHNAYLLSVFIKIIGIASSTILNFLRYRKIFLDSVDAQTL